MKARATKTTKLITACMIIVLILLCSFNVTFTYFTAVSDIYGSGYMGDLNVTFAYKTTNTTSYTTYSQEVLSVGLDTTEGVERGNSYNIQIANSNIFQLGFAAAEGSCDSLVKMVVDAYKVNYNSTSGEWELDTSDTTNYGKYFTVNGSSFTHSSGTNYYYYNYVMQVGFYGFNLAGEQTKIKVEDSLPSKMLDSDVKITISFKAVQAANNAYIAVFGEDSYPSTWENYVRR